MKNRLLSAIIASVLVFSSVPAINSSAAVKTATVVAFGDSIAAAGKWESEFTRLTGIPVVNSGVGGDTSANALTRFNSAVKAKNPDVVVIGFGTNDASIDMSRYVSVQKYAENLISIVRSVRALGALPLIVTPAPVGDADYLTRHSKEPFDVYGGPNSLVSLYARAARDVAAETKTSLADVNAAFSERDFVSLLQDGVHPTDAGYKLYGAVVSEAYAKAVRGDVNCDNNVGAVDYAMVKRAVIGSFTLDKAQSARADVNGDGNVTATDYAMLKRHVVGSYEIDRGIPRFPEPVGYTVEAALTPESRTAAVMAANTKELQACVDKVSAAGGGTVTLPAGTFYFSTQGMNARKYEDYVCMPRDNVLVLGKGMLTTLMPVGNTSGGLDMFYYNEYADSGFKNPKYLVNADFSNFVIDGRLAHAARYTSAGKGFMINLFRDCDYDNVIVLYTDGTGFGVDCPINCTIKNCLAFGCGKAATTSSYGASGFGIGTGYSESETMSIENCFAAGNKKFGFFFEHQGRFTPSAYRAQKLENCVVSGCTAKNNFNDFGGELALDLEYRSCVVPADTTSVTPIAFRQHCIRIRLTDVDVQARFEDVRDSSEYYYDAVYWAVNAGVTNGSGDNKFGIDDKMTRGQALTFLYRFAGMPGELILGNGAEGQYYEDAFKWAVKNGIAASGDDMTLPCGRLEFIEYRWKYDGSKGAPGSLSPSLNWAVETGLTSVTDGGDVLRRDALTLLYRYSQL